MINYEQLYYFWSVARYGGVTRAAEQLHLTPQTISGQIKELEASLNQALFRPRGWRLELTTAGKLAFSHAEEIFQIGQELEALMHGHQVEGTTLFRIGVSDVVPKSVTYRLLRSALRLPEPMRLICHEGKLDDLFARLAVHQVDLVIADRPLPPGLGVKGFSHLLGESELAFFAEPSLAERLRVGFPESLTGEPMLLPTMESASRSRLERWFRTQRIEPKIVAEFDDTALMKAFAQDGTGAFPAPEVIADEIARQHGAEIVGQVESLAMRYYAISAERKLRHPAVVAIAAAAENVLFSISGHRARLDA